MNYEEAQEYARTATLEDSYGPIIAHIPTDEEIGEEANRAFETAWISEVNWRDLNASIQLEDTTIRTGIAHCLDIDPNALNLLREPQ